MPSPEPGGGHAAAGISRCSRWRGGAWPLAARAQQAERDAAHRRAPARSRGRCGISGPRRGVPAGAGAIGLDHRPQRADRHPLGHGQCRRNSQTRGGIGRARAGRHPGPWRPDRGAVAAGDPHRADRVPDRRRSGRRRLRRQPGAAGRQRHRFHAVRIQLEREMAGAAQADRAGRDASGGPSGSRHTLRHRPVRRHPGRGAVARGGGQPGQRARRRRDRARRRGLRARLRMAA